MRELVVETNVYVLELPDANDKGIIYGTVAQGQNAVKIRTTEESGLRKHTGTICRVLARMSAGTDKTGRYYESMEVDKVVSPASSGK